MHPASMGPLTVAIRRNENSITIPNKSKIDDVFDLRTRQEHHVSVILKSNFAI